MQINIIDFGIKERETIQKSTTCICTAFQNCPKLYILPGKKAYTIEYTLQYLHD